MDSKRRLLILSVLLLGTFCARAQGTIDIKRVSSDSLVRVLRSDLGLKVYFLKDPQDVASYSVTETQTRFAEAAFQALRDKGYHVTSHRGGWYITSGKGLSFSGLPAGFFDSTVTGTAIEDNAPAAESQTVTFQNKVYEIGDPDKPSKSRAYVSGYVRHSQSGEPMPGVAVYDDAGVFTTTDASGFYRVQLSGGEHLLNFSGYSMEDLSVRLSVHSDGGLDVEMKDKVTALKGAEITADSRSAHRDAMMGIDRVRVSTINKIPTAFGEADVLKVVLTLPGVKTTGEAATGFNVRGGAADQNLILLNGSTIYNPSHMFGLLSSFNTDVINDVELYKSSIPAEYGGRISSVLDIRGKEGNSRKIKGGLGLGLLTSHLSLEGPLVKDRTTFVLGARTTYSNWLLGLLPDDSRYAGGSAGFSDVNLGITHKVDDKNTIQAFGYWSRDKFAFSNDTTFRYSSLNASVKWRSQLSERHTMTLAAGWDSFSNSLENAGTSGMLFGAADASSAYGTGYKVSSQVNQAWARLGMKISAGRHTISYGAQGTWYDLNPGTRDPLGSSRVTALALDRQNAWEAVGYASDALQIGEKLSVEYGTRLSIYRALNPSRSYFCPDIRLSGKYSLLDNLSLKAGFNSMSQAIHMISNSTSISPMDTWHLSSAGVRPQSGWQAASGLYWTVADSKIDISLEGYYKRMYHYLDYKSGAVLVMNPDLEDDLVETTGRAYGAELMIRKNSGKLSGWISYTYARTFLRETADRGVETINGGDWYRASHDKPHDVKAVANYKLTHRVSFSANLDYSTGRPVTLPVGRYRYNGVYYLAYSERNAERIPDYFRIDLALNVDPGHYLRQLTHMSFTMGVYNVTGRKNAYSVYYTADAKGNVSGHMMSVFAVPIPYLTLNLKF